MSVKLRRKHAQQTKKENYQDLNYNYSSVCPTDDHEGLSPYDTTETEIPDDGLIAPKDFHPIRSQLLTVIQLSLCLLLIAAALVIKTIGGDIYAFTGSMFYRYYNDSVLIGSKDSLFPGDDGARITETSRFTFNTEASGQSSGISENGQKTPQKENSAVQTSADTARADTDNAHADTDTSHEDTDTSHEDTDTSHEDTDTAHADTGNVKANTDTVQAGAEITGNNSAVKRTGNGSSLFPEGISLPLASGTVTSGYGIRERGTAQELHKGIDIGAENGTPVYALSGGKIITAGEDSSYGNYIIIGHKGGVRSLYAHCSSLLVKKDDTVSSGQKIALVGETGDADGPHLHLEIIENGSNIDPADVIGTAYV